MGKSSSHTLTWSVVTALIIFCLSYIGYTGIENYSKTPKWICLLILIIALLIAQRKQLLKWSWEMTFWSIFILQYLLQVTNSYNPCDALANALPLLIGPLLILSLFRDQNVSVQLGKFSILIAFITAPLILYGLYELAALFSNSDYTRTSSYGIRFGFGHKNQLSHFFVLLVPLYVLGITLIRQKWKKLLLICSIVAIYLFITLLMNRTSLILLYGVYPLGGIIYLVHKSVSGPLKTTVYSIIGAIVLVGVVLVFIIPSNLPLIGDWISSESGNERLMIWQNSFELAKEAPIIGHGSGDWKIEILRTSLEREGFEHQLFFQRAHNEFIHRLVENGLIGLIIFFTFFAYAIIRLIRSSMDFAFKLFSMVGLVGFFIISNLSFPLERVELVFLLFLFLIPGTKNIESPKPFVNYTLIGLATIGFIFSISWFEQEKRFFDFRQDDSIELTENLGSFTMDASSTPVAFYEGNYYFRRQNYEKATSAFQEADRYNPYHVHVLNNLASSQSLIGQSEEAKATYKRLFEIDSQFIEGLMNAASVHFNSGDLTQAMDYLTRIPASKEPENFQLFATTILKARLETLKSNSELTQRVNEITSSDDKLIQLFNLIREGKSVEHAINAL